MKTAPQAASWALLFYCCIGNCICDPRKWYSPPFSHRRGKPTPPASPYGGLQQAAAVEDPFGRPGELPAHQHPTVLYPGRIVTSVCNPVSACVPVHHCPASIQLLLTYQSVCRWEQEEPFVCCTTRPPPPASSASFSSQALHSSPSASSFDQNQQNQQLTGHSSGGGSSSTSTFTGRPAPIPTTGMLPSASTHVSSSVMTISTNSQCARRQMTGDIRTRRQATGDNRSRILHPDFPDTENPSDTVATSYAGGHYPQPDFPSRLILPARPTYLRPPLSHRPLPSMSLSPPSDHPQHQEDPYYSPSSAYDSQYPSRYSPNYFRPGAGGKSPLGSVSGRPSLIEQRPILVRPPSFRPLASAISGSSALRPLPGFSSTNQITPSANVTQLPITSDLVRPQLPFDIQLLQEEVTLLHPETWPFMVGIYIKSASENIFLCAGSLITANAVLTAAQCFLSRSPSDVYLIRMGDTFLNASVDPLSVFEFESSNVSVHPDFRFPELYHDIALLRFAGFGREGDLPPLACLVADDIKPEALDNANATVLGWSGIFAEEPNSKILREVNIPIVSNEFCNGAYAALRSSRRHLPDGITDGILCAGNIQEDKNACIGDLGGPLVIIDSNSFIRQVGIVSRGYQCDVSGAPGIHTNLFQYLDWIKQNV